jgi:hypothetical protein
VYLKTDNKMEIVVQEILQDKVFLDSKLNVQVAGTTLPGAAPELDLGNL